MSKVKIGYKNLLDYLTTVTFTTGSEDGDHPFANVYDNLLFDYMRLAAAASAYQIDIELDAARSADYFGAYYNNLAAAGATIQLLYWDGSAFVPAFQNLIRNSEKLNTSPWSVVRATVAEGAYTLPNEVELSKITEDNSNNTHYTGQSSITIAQNTTYYATFFVKKGSASRNIGIQAVTSGGTGVTYGVSINPDTGVLTAGVGATAFASVSATLVKGEADAWIITASFPSGNNTTLAAVVAPYSAAGNISYAGDAASFVYAGGVQITSRQNQSYVHTLASTTQGLAPRNSRPVFISFPSVSSDEWRLQIDNNNTDVTMADIKFGEQITTEYGLYMGFPAPELAREVEYDDNKSDGGLMLGRSIRSLGFKTTCNFEFMSDAWLRSTWKPFVVHAEKYPFYFAWNFTDYPHEIAFANTDGKIGKPTPAQYGRQQVNLNIVGYIE